MSELALAFAWARRELRAGLGGFWVFLACLALGVGAIAGVGAVSQAVQDALHRDARALAGGDVVVRTSYEPASADQIARMRAESRTLSQGIEMRVMAGGREATERRLAELKAVDPAYPVAGAFALKDGGDLHAALAERNGRWGAVAEQDLVDLLQLRPGDPIHVGSQTYDLRGVIAREPDRTTGLASFGPRLMVAEASVAGTGLILPGSLIRYVYRIALPPRADALAWAAALEARFPTAPLRITPASRAAPGLEDTVGRLTLFLTLVGLTALLIGGIGIANAVQSFMGRKTGTIAVLKCVGAPARLILLTYALQTAALAVLGIAIGLVLGTLAPFALAALLESLLPVHLEPTLYPQALALGAAYGVLTTAAFALWPLLKSRRIAPARLFRDLVAPTGGRPTLAETAVIAGLLALLALLAVLTAEQRGFALWFVAGVAAAFVLFYFAARALAWLARRLARSRLVRQRPSLRLGLANLSRPGAPTVSVVLSLGFGVTVLVAVAGIEANLGKTLREDLPAEAPTFFFIDIQPNQLAAFRETMASVPGDHDLKARPMLRARIVKINGKPAREEDVAENVRWAVRSERGLTFQADPPETGTIVAGRWWPPDYRGPPLISFHAGIAAGMGIGVGDTLTFNILGREITATIANLRAVDFRSVRMQFTTIFAPGTLESAPHTILATTRTPPEHASELLRAVSAKFPNISAVRVKEALESFDRLIRQIGNAIRVIAAVGLIAGVLVLASAVASGQQARRRNAVILKVLGATRPDVLSAYLWEFGVLGIGTVGIAAGIGGAAAYIVVTQVMNLPWSLPLGAIALTAPLALAITLVAGFAGVWQALGQKPAPLLRNA
ncbi:MAG: FtsX-like permease family protein [Alphaproteobacteria bacterium]|nr:FtsX-like permease family protein [Alphaproteobacteria bacterium]MCB9931612.1 FtsX-like permease family protein [Alphaproteobacteria bacterium]